MRGTGLVSEVLDLWVGRCVRRERAQLFHVLVGVAVAILGLVVWLRFGRDVLIVFAGLWHDGLQA